MFAIQRGGSQYRGVLCSSCLLWRERAAEILQAQRAENHKLLSVHRTGLSIYWRVDSHKKGRAEALPLVEMVSESKDD
ncbi:MAG: hypothetical protein ACI9FG_001786 [Crocinitomicaceae bacterium]|jgi:hypothetical protein